jgi:hypothetical protein
LKIKGNRALFALFQHLMQSLRATFLIIAIAMFPTMPGCAATSKTDAASSRLVSRTEKPVNLSRSTRVTLKGKTLASRLDSLRGRRLFLLIGDLRADRQPGTGFEIYLDLPEGASPSETHHAGSFNYYNAVIGETGRPDAFFSFDITDVARALRGRGLLRDATTLTIVPSDGKPEGHAVIGRIEIVEQ